MHRNEVYYHDVGDIDFCIHTNLETATLCAVAHEMGETGKGWREVEIEIRRWSDGAIVRTFKNGEPCDGTTTE